MTEPEKKTGKQTPGRQRPGQSSANRSTNRRNYASENDVARNDPSLHTEFVPKARNQGGGGGGGPSTPQKTPRKSHKPGSAAKSPAPVPGLASGAPNSNKRNNNDKLHAKNPPASPAVAAAKAAGGRRTPPPPSAGRPIATGSATPAATAFAGATFHASPAPSALPLPSFFTKKSPGTPTAEVSSVRRTLHQQPSPPASDSEVPSSMATRADSGVVPPVVPASNPASVQQNETPLETLFRADRAEKERIRRASSANISGTVTAAPFSPPAPVHMQFDHANSNTFPRGPSQQQHQHYLMTQQQQQTARHLGSTTRSSSSGISAAELDGTPGRPLGPSFATSFQERMRAVRSSSSRMTGSSASGSHFSNQPGFRDVPSGTGSMPFPPTNFEQQLPATEFGVEGRKDARSEALLRFVQSPGSATAAPAASGAQHPSGAVFRRQPYPPAPAAPSSGYLPQNAPSVFSTSVSSSPSALANNPAQHPMNSQAGGPYYDQPNRMDNLVRSWINRSSPHNPGAPPPPSF